MFSFIRPIISAAKIFTPLNLRTFNHLPSIINRVASFTSHSDYQSGTITTLIKPPIASPHRLFSTLPSLSGYIKSTAYPTFSQNATDLLVRDSFHIPTKQELMPLERVYNSKPKPKRRLKLTPIGYAPHLKGVVLRTLIRKPKKPNSANRKCVLVRLSNGKETVAFVPGEGHNLQEHSTVLVYKHRTKDLIGVKLRVKRGAYDCAHVKKKTA